MKNKSENSKKTQEMAEPINIKKQLIYSAISLVVLSLITALVGYLDVVSKGVNFQEKPMIVLADAFFVSGILGVLFWLLLLVSQIGAFDMIVYGVRKFLVIIFRKHPEDSTLPETYYDYEMIKRGQKHNRFYAFLIVSCLFFIVGVILSFIANSMY